MYTHNIIISYYYNLPRASKLLEKENFKNIPNKATIPRIGIFKN